MKALFFGLTLFTFSLLGSETLSDSVVQIITTHKTYDYDSPWSPPSTERSMGSGFIIDGNRVVTNAHVINHASFIEVRSASSREWYEANTMIVGHDCDLAILELEDSSFFEGKVALEFSDRLLHQQEEVAVHGFPMGGRELSITKGIVSRVELGSYAHAGTQLLVSQIDAPINLGNSGGPVISDGKVVGVAHQVFFVGQNIGYMIPIPVIKHFMEEVEKGEYLGFPKNPFAVQIIRNPAMRAFYGLEKGQGGLLVIDVPENHFLTDLLQPRDILLELDGYEIDAHGWVDFEDVGISLPFQYLIMMKHFGDQIDLTVIREGETLELSSFMDPQQQGTPLVDQEFDKPPTYYIAGGLVFQPLVTNLFDDMDIDVNLGFIDLFHDLLRGKVNDERDEVVVLSRVLDDVVNVGYQHLEKKIVDSVNGKKIQNMRDLIDTIENGTDPFIFIITRDHIEVVLDREEVNKRSDKILNRYFISHDRSGDLL